jgi:hypothetical protein
VYVIFLYTLYSIHIQSRSDDTYLAMSHLSDRTTTTTSSNTTIHASDIIVPTSSTQSTTSLAPTNDITLRDVRANQRAQSALQMRRELLGASELFWGFMFCRKQFYKM